MRALPVLAITCGLAAGCAPRVAPYRFGSPMVGGLHAGRGTLHLRAPSEDPWSHGLVEEAAAHIRHTGGGGIDLGPIDRPRSTSTAGTVVVGEDLGPGDPPSGVVISRLPHHQGELRARAGAAAALPAIATADGLLGWVGTRDGRDEISFARDAACMLTGAPSPGPIAGPELLERAQAAGTLDSATAAAQPGDLLVFDRVIGDAPASLAAVVIGRDPRGVVQMVYVGGGVIRRGFVDVTRPHLAHEPDRRVVNSFLRHGTDWPPKGTRFLAGELLAAVIHVGADASALCHQ